MLAGLAAAGVPMLTDDMGMLTRGRGPELALGYLRFATSTAPVVPLRRSTVTPGCPLVTPEVQTFWFSQAQVSSLKVPCVQLPSVAR